MKIKYQFTQETVEIEVDESWGDILIDLERQEYNNNQTETRRHLSLDGMNYEGEYFIDQRTNIPEEIEKTFDNERLQNALAVLLPQQKDLIYKVYCENRSIASIATAEGVDESAIRDRLKRIKEKLKKYLE